MALDQRNYDPALRAGADSTFTQLNYSTLNDGTTSATATTLEINRTCDASGRMVAGGSTLTITEALHDGKVIKLDTAAGTTCTLPAATGSGAKFKFLITTIATTNNHIVKVANANDTMMGTILTVADSGDTVYGWIAGATADTITLNRTTTGSVTIGEWVEVMDVATNKFSVTGVTTASGTEATPFSATVS